MKRARVEEKRGWTNRRDDPCWFNFPLDCFLVENEGEEDESKLVMFCAPGSDVLAGTGHAYLGCAGGCEVGFSAQSLREEFDQAGLLARVDQGNWIKAGVEIMNGEPLLSCLVKRNGVVDWSTQPWPSSSPRERGVTIKLSVSARGDGDDDDGGVVLVHYKLQGEEGWTQMRLCSGFESGKMVCGPYACAPNRDGLYCEFNRYVKAT
ncbi:hypothetical protein BASA81_004921 [Batrachochytrium salamandrivorans]|nr:hypothetical protein BASA81_004921 [Batrachochytrium salamandrivorans]